MRPLPDTHPEFTITHWPGFTEYRVEHWRLARDGTGRVIRGTSVCAWVDVAAVLVFAYIAFFRAGEHLRVAVGSGLVLSYLLWTRLTQVLHESLLVFPIGIQLETHRGHPLLPTLSRTHHFIPRASLEDLVLHEALHGWNVRFYLAALQRRNTQSYGSDSGARPDGIQVHVAFENTLPYFPVLRAVYLGVQETLFPPPTRIVQED